MALINRLPNQERNARTSVSKRPSDHFLTHKDFALITFLNNLLPDPDLVLQKAGLTSDVYYELMTDSHVGGSVMQRKSRVKRMELVFLSGEPKNAKADAALDLVQRQIEEIQRIPEVVNEILDAPLYGATYLEMFWNRLPITSDRPNGEIVLTDIMAKPFEWFVYDIDNVLKVKDKNVAFGYSTRDIPPNKVLPVVKDQTYKNPYGERAFKRAFWPYQFKKGGVRFWTEFLEKYGMPFLFGKLDAKKSDEDLNQFYNDLVDMVRNGVVVSRSDTKEEIDVVESKSRGSSSDTYKAYKNAMNIEISKAILGETLTIENSESGSQAATETHLEVLEAIQDEDRAMTERTFDRIARLLTDLNFGKDVKSPYCRLIDPKELSLKQAERDATLADKIGVKFNKAYISDTYKIDEDYFEMGEPAPKGTNPPKSTKKTPEPTAKPAKDGTESIEEEDEFAERFPIQDGVDRFIDGSLERLEGVDDALQAELKEIVKTSKDYAELISRLSSLKDKIDSRYFSPIFSQVLDIAYVVGEYGVNEQRI